MRDTPLPLDAAWRHIAILRGAPLRSWSGALLVAAAYYLSARISLSITFQSTPISPVWPPNAIVLVALLLVPMETWWVYLLAVFGAHMLVELPHGVPLATTTGLYFTNAGEAALGAYLVRRLSDGAPWLGTLRKVAVFLVGAVVVAPVITSFGDAAIVVLTGWADNYWLNWQTRCVSNVLMQLTISPALLLALTGARGWMRGASRLRWTEAAILSATLLVVSIVAFGGQITPRGWAPILVFAVLPVLFWAAVRFGMGGTSAALLGITIVATWSAAQGRGPFSTDTPTANAIALQLFLICIAIPMLVLAAVIDDRQHALAELQTSQAHYRDLVESQTELVCRYLPDSTLTYANEAYCRAYGKTREQLVGTKFLEHMDQPARDHHLHYTAQLVARADTATDEHEFTLPNGRIVWQQWVDHPIFDAEGQLVEIQSVGRDVTERKQAEEALRASEARYRAVVRNLPNAAVLLFDAQLHHTFADGPGLQMLDRTSEQLEGRTVREAFPSDLAAALAPHYEAAARRGQAADFDVEYAEHIYRIQVVPMPSAPAPGPALAPVTETPASTARTPMGMVVLRDITEQRRARDELVQERTRTAVLGALSQEFRTLAEHSPDLIARFDPAGHFVYVNQAGTDQLGWPAEQWIGKTFAELGVPRPVFEPWAQALRDVVQTRERRTFDIETRVSDGQVLSLHARFIPEFADDGRTVLSVLAIATDVSALKHAETRLAEQAAELEAIFEAKADGMAVFDLQGRFVRANSALRHLLGFDADTGYTARPLDERAQRLLLFDEHGQPLTPEQWPQWRVLRGEILAGASAMETGVRTVDARVLWISVTGAPVRGSDGQTTGVVLVTRDVTVRRELEQQVRELAHELETILDASPDVIAVCDQQGHLVRANRTLRETIADIDFAAFATLSPAARAEHLRLRDVQGRPFAAEDLPDVRALRGEVLVDRTTVDVHMLRPDGDEVTANVAAAPVYDQEGRVIRAVTVWRDVTKRRQLERQLERQAAEQGAVAERTRLAHELHDTVTQEIYSAGLLAESITRNWQEHRADAEAALAQLPRVIRGALAGLRVLLLELRPSALDELPLATLLRQLVEAMSNRANVPIAVHLDGSAAASERTAGLEPEPELPPRVKVVFYRVAQEALMNAVKYARARTIGVELRARGSDELELEIADDGQGFDASAIPAGHFGLAIMRERAEAVGAAVQVRSQPGQGTHIIAMWPSERQASGYSIPPEGDSYE